MSITYVNDDGYYPSNEEHPRWEHEGYELVVGLVVHVELATRTKLFSASPNPFGDEPNTNIISGMRRLGPLVPSTRCERPTPRTYFTEGQGGR